MVYFNVYKKAYTHYSIHKYVLSNVVEHSALSWEPLQVEVTRPSGIESVCSTVVIPVHH